MEILWGVLILLAIGLLLGLGLAIAAKLLYVKEDERIEEVAKKLPNYNCGSCGYAGCKALAEAIVTGKEENIRKCKPGKEDLNFKPIIEYLDAHPNEDGSKVTLIKDNQFQIKHERDTREFKNLRQRWIPGSSSLWR